MSEIYAGTPLTEEERERAHERNVRWAARKYRVAEDRILAVTFSFEQDNTAGRVRGDSIVTPHLTLACQGMTYKELVEQLAKEGKG